MMHKINTKKQNELELLARMKVGDVNVFEYLFRLYWSKCFRLAFSIIREVEPAEEAVQDVFINIWKNRETIHIDMLSHYLHVATKNNILKYIRYNANYSKHLEYYHQFCTIHLNATTENEISHHELQQLYDESTQCLKGKTKEIFRLSRMDGLSNSEISKQLKITEKAVEYHITQSLRFLKKKLKDYLF